MTDSELKETIRKQFDLFYLLTEDKIKTMHPYNICRLFFNRGWIEAAEHVLIPNFNAEYPTSKE